VTETPTEPVETPPVETPPVDAPRSSSAAIAKVNDAASLLASNSASTASRAVGLLEEAIRLDPELAIAYLNLGVAKKQLGDAGAAKTNFEIATVRDPSLGEAWLYLGLSQAAAGDTAAALATFRQGVEKAPSSMELRVGLVDTLRKTGRLDEAISEAKTALKQNSNSLAMYDALGATYLAKGDLTMAKFVYQKAIQGVSGAENNAGIRTNLGYISLKRGEKALALYHLEAARKLDPSHIPALVYLGGIYLDDRNYQDALPLWETVVKAEPKNHDARLNAGISYRGLGRYPEAQAAYEKALELEPANPDPWFNLGILYGDFVKVSDPTLESYDKAVAAFEKYIAAGGKQKELATTFVSDLQKEKKRAEKKKSKGG